MSLKQKLTEMYSAFSGKEKPQDALNEFMTDEGLKQHIAIFEAAFPKYELHVNDLVEEDNKVVARVTFKGEHRGELFGIPATFKHVELPFLAIYYYENGKISDHFISANQLEVIKQLEGVPEMALEN